mmetsp:Transcript_9824/g.28235  ORF Transcript_9824/g.28235 Transcript_9824/m.28235 type:complete len:92 (-) Transcript_9824:50-325(-)
MGKRIHGGPMDLGQTIRRSQLVQKASVDGGVLPRLQLRQVAGDEACASLLWPSMTMTSLTMAAGPNGPARPAIIAFAWTACLSSSGALRGL